MRKNNLAYREAFLAGRLGIRAKILIYLAVLAGFIISAVWMLQGVLVYGVSRGLNVPPQLLDASRTQFWLTVGAILIATALVGFTMARSISEPIIETNEAAKQLSESRYKRPPHSGGYREIAELNDTLVRAAENLGKVEDLQRELIANISHDLRTPLTMIIGYAEAMRDIPEEVTPENMQIIIDETNRLNSMVNEVLDFSRLRTGNLELEEKPFSLTEQIREIVGRISKMTAAEGYTLLFDPPEERTVTGDSGRISQVLYNLIGNALTYTGEDKTVRITQRDTGSGVRVEISDSGEGIPKDELPYIFDRYYRSRENHRRAVIGSGLGLNICRSILEKHGARYGVRSEEGQGTTFWFELPGA
uniref:histidine kinase n=1 Tax=uncultured bacterium Contigcl_1774 TaxID=1393661 RepID=W0FSR7_9BACT|nr:histidine kinase [uncultured bacterium Contigcl_1774]